MRILFIANRHKPAFGGSEEVQRKLQHLLADQGHEVVILTTDFKYQHGYEKLMGSYPGVIKFKSFRVVKDPLTISFPMYTWIAKHALDFDAIFAFTYGYHTSIIPVLMKKLGIIKTPIIFQPHYGPNKSLSNFFVKLFDFTLGSYTVKNSDYISLLTNKYKSFFIKLGALPENIFVIPPLVPAIRTRTKKEISTFLLKHRIPTSKKYLLSMGRVVKYKGIQYVLKGLSSMRQQNPILYDKYHLIVCGEGDYVNSLVNLSQDLSITDKVTFITKVTDDDRELVYNIGDIFTFLSYSGESFGLVMAEAMSLGLPVIASDQGANDAVVTDNKSGLIINYLSEEEFVKAVKTIDSNYEYFSENAKQESNRYSSESINQSLVSLLGNISRKKERKS